MKIEMKRDGDALIVIVKGKINTDTAPQLETAVKEQVAKKNLAAKEDTAKEEAYGEDAEVAISKVIFDFKEVEYISSAGLRVVMNTYKLMNKTKDGVKVREANENVKEVFHITGFDKFLTVE